MEPFFEANVVNSRLPRCGRHPMVQAPGATGRPTPLIAIVMRCHQQGAFLGDAIETVNTQTTPPAEIVVVNDGSTDTTDEVLARLSCNPVPVRAVARHPARGSVASLNDGIAIAEDADLICVLDADDRLSPRFLELTSKALIADPTVDLAYGAVHAFGSEEWTARAQPFDLDKLLVENQVPITALFRRSMYESLGPFDPAFERVGFEDWEYWTRAAVAGHRGIPVEGCWLEYRRHDAGSRNQMGLARSLRARRQIWWKHRRALRPRHVTTWMASVARAKKDELR